MCNSAVCLRLYISPASLPRQMGPLVALSCNLTTLTFEPRDGESHPKTAVSDPSKPPLTQWVWFWSPANDWRCLVPAFMGLYEEDLTLKA